MGLIPDARHEFELASRDSRRVNALVRGRFDRLCAFLEAHAAEMPTAGFTELDDIVLAARSRPLPEQPLRTVRRLVEQAWGNARYEWAGAAVHA